MSVIVTLCLHDGIVMAADSRMTLTKTYPNGEKEISYEDGLKKIFKFGERDIGIAWCGNAQVAKEEIPDYLNGFYNRVSKTATIKEIAEKLNSECNEKVQGETIRCHIAGYEDGTQCLYQVVDGIVTHKNIHPDFGVPTICIVWDGQRDISGQIVHNKERIDIGDKLVNESDIPSFTLEEGVRFAEAMLKRSCEELDVCGEPIYSLIITTNGLRWIHA